jgi:hypothetical protein
MVKCPHCPAEYDIPAPEREGNGVCGICGGWFTFDAAGTIRSFEPEDLLTTDDQMLQVMRRATARAQSGMGAAPSETELLEPECPCDPFR